MKHDILSRYTIASALKPDAYTAAAYVPVTNTAIVKLGENGGSVAWLIDVGTVGTDGTIDAKVQRSADGTTFTDQPSGEDGNDTAITQITATGSAVLSINNPSPDYPWYALHVTVGTATCDVGAVSVVGPKRHVEPT